MDEFFLLCPVLHSAEAFFCALFARGLPQNTMAMTWLELDCSLERAQLCGVWKIGKSFWEWKKNSFALRSPWRLRWNWKIDVEHAKSLLKSLKAFPLTSRAAHGHRALFILSGGFSREIETLFFLCCAARRNRSHFESEVCSIMCK